MAWGQIDRPAQYRRESEKLGSPVDPGYLSRRAIPQWWAVGQRRPDALELVNASRRQRGLTEIPRRQSDAGLEQP